MPDALEQARSETIQSRAREGGLSSIGGLSLLLMLGQGGDIVSPWWSRQRDAELRAFWKQIDYLAGAVYTLESRMVTVPFHVFPLDLSVSSHQRQAEEFQRLLSDESEFGEGWITFYSKFVEDLITQDNGTFGEVIGEGSPAGPIVGRPLGLAHLDSARCRRTGDPEFPVVYTDQDGNPYKLHFTRVIYASQMPSPMAVMNGVGLCAVSRCLNVAQVLLDQLIYKQEKLGSRPQRSILVTKGGLDPEDVRDAFKLAAEVQDSQGLKRFAKTVVIGSKNLVEAGLEEVDLASLPDGFDEQQSLTLGMAAISLAFGVDARELFPGLESGATRAEALIAHIKQRGKGPGHILQITEQLINAKFLPPTLRFEFDFQDDEQDRAVAEIKKARGENWVQLASVGLLDTRTIREQMLEEGDLSQEQFDRLELDDGRLPDGSEVLSLFHREDFAQFLDLEVENPLDTEANLAADMLARIEQRSAELMAEVANARPGERTLIEQALAALKQLKRIYGGLSARLTEPRTRPITIPAPAPATPSAPVPGGESEEPEAREEQGANMPPFSSEDLELKSRDSALKEAALAIKEAANRIGANGRERKKNGTRVAP